MPLKNKIQTFQAKRRMQVARGQARISTQETEGKKSNARRLIAGKAAARGLIESTKTLNKLSLSRKILKELDADRKKQ